MILAAYDGKTTAGIDYGAHIDNGWSRDDDTEHLDSGWNDAFRAAFEGRLPTRSETLLITLDLDKPYKNAKGEQVNSSDYPIPQDEILRRIPPLNRFSDVIWTVWNTLTKTPHDLRYIGQNSISNDDTIAIMKRIFNRPQAKGPVIWPGLSYTLQQDEGLALLGSPNGLGIAWLLIDRAGKLGPRFPKVTIFTEPGGKNYRMWWDLRPVGAV
ncbi:MAG: hypothetical protein Q9170_001378 [Blastenia crenularia]